MENAAHDHNANNQIGGMETGQTRGLYGYVLRIFKTFLLFAVGFGFLFGIYLSIKIGSLYGFIQSLVAGAMGALIFVLVVTAIDIFFKIKCYVKYGIMDFEISQVRKFRANQDHLLVFNAACEVLESRKKVQILVKDVKKGIVEAERSLWGGVGEQITVRVMGNAGNNKVMVTVSSKPKCFLTMMDASKNFENVQQIIQGIRKRLKEEGIGRSSNSQQR